MGEPSEREALLTILLSYACKGVLQELSPFGVQKNLFCQLKAGHIYTYGLFVHVSMHM
jgi:hypothetical protein